MRSFVMWTTIVIAAACVLIALWWHLGEPRTDAVRPDWTATVAVLAGDGVAGTRDGDRADARFTDPFGVAIGADGTIYVADGANSHRIRRISPDGRVSTIAGGEPGFADGVGEAARFSTPSAVAIDASGTLYVADTGNHAIRRITTDGRVSTLAGDGVAGDRDGPAQAARFNGPIGIAFDHTATGRVIVADTYNDRIRAIDPDGTVRTLAGAAGPGAVDGAGSEARFHTPSGVAIDRSGTLYVSDTGNGLIRTIDATGLVTTPMWSWTAGLFRPIGMAVGAAGEVYVADERGSIVEILADGSARTLAGSTTGFRDGLGPHARFRRPTGVAVAAPGRLIVADSGNSLVRVVAAPAQLEFGPPTSPRINPRFDAEAFGLRTLIWPIDPIEGPHEIAGTLGEARGGDGEERVHAGIDVRGDQGTLVYAVRDGIAITPISTNEVGHLTESLRIGPVTYMHIRTGRGRRGEVFDADRFVPTYEGGKLVEIRVKRGTRFAAGDVVGTVNAFNHVHLNVGWSGEEHNPLGFRLVQFVDTVPPTIAPGGVRVSDSRGQPLTRRIRGRVVVSGPVQIVVDAWDQVNGNRPSRRLGLYDLGYQVLTPNGSPVPGFEAVRHTMRFDRLAIDADAARLAYAPGSGIPFYGRRRTRFLYIVTNTLRDGVAKTGFWDTSLLAPGDYIVRAWVADIRGNAAAANRDLAVTIVSSD